MFIELSRQNRLRLLFILECVFWASVCYSGLLFSDEICSPVKKEIGATMPGGINPASRLSRKYDSKIKQSSRLYMPGVDWRLYKSQLYQESLLNPEAVSPVGAVGIAQFMPGTWSDVSKALKFGSVSPRDANAAIQAGAYYMGNLRRGWSSPRPEKDRHSLALASYNAGFGNILKSQKRCSGAILYPDIIQCLPDITGSHSLETTTYVRRIWTIYFQEITS